ncbi:MAG: Ornithine carbamoyltransferase [Syntrophorhabdaceae bacterium PtaU1.Bin034]|jgi:ornithine carbamoyltransferase|nr:MAG: Ornithine carbamoyltransferase [Syntrophorhabdaceae bacterium PtaU1.Bin034]
MKRDFTRLLDTTTEECTYLLERAAFLKQVRKTRGEYKPLKDRTLAMIFEKASTRTRISFEVGIQQLGGNALFLSPSETQMGRGEPVRDTARVLSRYADAIMIRTYSQQTVEELARWASIPVINGLSDLYHPCQILADLLTVKERKGNLTDMKIAYVGDGNNIANSWIEASILFGFPLAVASPEGYGPFKEVVDAAEEKGTLTLTTDPFAAAKEADVINTDVWVSMGMEKEKEERKQAFGPFRLDDELMKVAKPDAIVMHCLPAHRDQEITDAVFERFQDVIFTQAENRLYVQQALLEWLITKTDE